MLDATEVPPSSLDPQVARRLKRDANGLVCAVVQRGPHARLAAQTDSIYARLYASWLEQTR